MAKTDLMLINKELGKENNEKVVDLIKEIYPYLNLESVAKLVGISKSKVAEIIKANNLSKKEEPTWYSSIPVVIWLPRNMADKVEDFKFIEKNKIKELSDEN